LITNGTRLTQDFIDSIKTLPVNISVSLDTLDRQRYKAVRGADQLNLVLSGIERLRTYPHPKYLTCIVSEQNRNDVTEVIRYARDNDFMPIVGAYHWDVGRYGRIDGTLQYRHEKVIDLFERILETGLVPRGYYRDYIRDNIAWLRGEKLNRCDAGRYSIVIDASGNVAPCLALNHAGNLREASLEKILAGFDHDAIKTCSDNSSCNMMCSRIAGSMVRHPVSTLTTPKIFSALTK
jgi:MoaA/NifB/PqqE/SkfB family radical SAM enzyme